MDTRHIERAIIQAKKEKNQGVRGFIGGFKENEKINQLLNEGKLEIFTQKYKLYDTQEGFCSCLLLRKPKK
jgi:hypothetical protein